MEGRVMKVYIGTVALPGDWQVSVHDLIDGTTLPLTHHVLHSPDGFAWGYPGAGPTELARCLLMDATGATPDPRLVNRYRRQVIELLDKETGFTIGQNSILTWVRNEADPEE